MSFSRDLLYTRHRLSHQQINDWFDEPEFPIPIEDKLSDMAKAAEFIAVTDNFREYGIEFISMKGPLLSHRLYGDTTYRRYRDFDFLFDQYNAEKAYKMLIEIGYHPYNLEIPKTESKKKEFFKHIHDTPLYNSANGIIIEIHTKLFRYRHLPQDELNKIIKSNLTPVELSGRQFTVLNNELELLYLIIHGGLHRFRRLKWLVDIKDFLKSIPFDQKKFETLAHELNANRLVGLCNAVLQRYYSDEDFFKDFPKPKKRILRNVVTALKDKDDQEAGTFKKFISFIAFTLWAQPGWRYKQSVMFKHLYLSYAVNSDNQSKSPLVLDLLKVPFKTAARWLSRKNRHYNPEG